MKVVALVSMISSAVAFAPVLNVAQTSKTQLMGVKEDVAMVAVAAGMMFGPMANIANAADIENGATIFAGNCAACHAGGNNVIQTEKTLKKEALDAYLDGGRKEASVVYQVTNGKNAMPAFGGRLSDDEIKDVASYVIDQANGDKWE